MRPHNTLLKVQQLAALAQRRGQWWASAQARVRLLVSGPDVDLLMNSVQELPEVSVPHQVGVDSVPHQVGVDLVRLRVRDWQEPVDSEVDSVLHQAEPADLARQRTPQPALGLVFLQDSAHRWLQRE
jgi:hypothetical protein